MDLGMILGARFQDAKKIFVDFLARDSVFDATASVERGT